MIKIDENVSLKDKTSFRIGGVANCFALVSSQEDLSEAYAFSKKRGLQIFVLGDGTDILVSDKRFESFVIKFTNKNYSAEKVEDSKWLVKAGAGLNWDDFVAMTVKENLQGIECLSGIPGTVGASPVQNIGAYGQEAKDALYEVKAFDIKEEKFITLNNTECKFEYRESIFKKEKGRYFIFEVSFILTKDGAPTLTYSSLLKYLEERGTKNPSLAEVRQAVISIRNKKLENPAEVGNAGSFFKNPIINREMLIKIQSKFPDIPFFEFQNYIKIPAGWLIDKSGLKGESLGGASVSEANALVIINKTGEAKAEEVRELAERIAGRVKDKFGITLEPEVQFINF